MDRGLLWYSGVIAIATSFTPGPSVLSLGAFAVNVFDAASVVLVALYAIYRITYGSRFVSYSRLSIFALCYPYTVIVFTTVGLIVYQYPTKIIVGDYRWIQAILIVSIVVNISKKEHEFINMMGYGILLSLVINILFLSLQVDALLTGDPTSALEWWFSDLSNSANRPLGYEGTRFSGAGYNPSALGLFSTVSIIYSLIYLGKRPLKGVCIVASLVLLVASGHRTSIVSLICVLLGYILTYGKLYETTLVILYGMAIVVIASIVFNIENLINTGRYQKILLLLRGEASYSQVASRVGTWKNIYDIQSTKYVLLGTLSNPSRVLSGIVIDSSYMYEFARLGTIGLFSMVLSVFTNIVQLINNYGRELVLFIGGILVLILVNSINQTVVTKVSGKMLYAMCCLSLNTYANQCIKGNV